MTRRATCLAGLAAAIVVASPLVATRNAAAEIILWVDSLLDQPDTLTNSLLCHTAAGTCTLRAAVMHVNRSCVDSATILLPAGLYTLTIPAIGFDGDDSGDVNLYGAPCSAAVVNLIGAGARTTIIDGNHLNGIFSIASSQTVNLSGVTLRNGDASVFGGAIVNAGTLTVTRSTISGNQAGIGGGIANGGTLTVSESTISGNHSERGGGIFNLESLFVVNSTISENDAGVDGGGIYNGDLSSGGGGISAIANVYNTTIAFNGADSSNVPVVGATGGGVYNGPAGTFNLRNSLVAGNIVQNTSIYDDCAGTLSSYGRNLFGEMGAPVPCTISLATGTWAPLNSILLLGALQDNGGPTQTDALLPGNSAVEGGDPTYGCTDYDGNTIATDQRGRPRVQGGSCDIGAFELPEPDSVATAAVAIATLASMRRTMRGIRTRDTAPPEAS